MIWSTPILFIKNGPPSYSINVVAAVISKNPSYLEDTEKCIIDKVDQKRVQQVCILVNTTLWNVSKHQAVKHTLPASSTFPSRAFSHPVTLIKTPRNVFPETKQSQIKTCPSHVACQSHSQLWLPTTLVGRIRLLHWTTPLQQQQ